MGVINWNSGLETGLAILDQQHQAMVSAYNALQATLKRGEGADEQLEALIALRDRTLDHFTFEEGLMDREHYAGATGHKTIHADLLSQLGALVDRFRADKTALTVPVMDFLGGWLVFHIKDEDLRLIQFLKR